MLRYPHIPGNPRRDGDPICDRFAVSLFQNRSILCIADGCNWGPRPRDAATNATNAFIHYVKSHHHDTLDVKEFGPLLLRAFAAAHEAVRPLHCYNIFILCR
jgi:hypothetical protein